MQDFSIPKIRFNKRIFVPLRKTHSRIQIVMWVWTIQSGMMVHYSNGSILPSETCCKELHQDKDVKEVTGKFSETDILCPIPLICD